jgi:hypothetical protein
MYARTHTSGTCDRELRIVKLSNAIEYRLPKPLVLFGNGIDCFWNEFQHQVQVHLVWFGPSTAYIIVLEHGNSVSTHTVTCKSNV